MRGMLCAALAVLAFVPTDSNGLRAADDYGAAAGAADPMARHRATLAQADAQLTAARPFLPDCESGCITPGEATVMAFAAPEGSTFPGRFLLDIQGGGQSLHGELGQMLFVNSRRDYATLGTLTVAFERDALAELLRRARVCGAAEVVDGQITVKACKSQGSTDLNMFTMIQRLDGRRIVVEGDLRLQWVDSALGAPRPVANRRGAHEPGYYQVWVQVSDAAQVIFVGEE